MAESAKKDEDGINGLDAEEFTTIKFLICHEDKILPFYRDLFYVDTI